MASDNLEVNLKAQEITKKWSVETDKLLGLCLPLDTSKDGLASLQQCKTKFLDTKNQCKDESFSKTDFCLNTDFQKLDESFDQRIIKVEEKIQALKQNVEDLEQQRDALVSARPEFNADVFKFANDSVLGFLDYCTEYPSESCTKDAKEMLRLCSIDASVNACSDPRLKVIANLSSNQEPTQQKLETKIDYMPLSRDECISGKVCFVRGDYLIYATFLSEEPFSITNYSYAGPLDIGKILVNIDYMTIEATGNYTHPQEVKPLELCCILNSGGMNVIGPTMMKQFTKESPSAETSMNGVVESSYNYNGFMRKVSVFNIESPSNIFDIETGILLFHQDNMFGPTRIVKLVDTNIIRSSNTDN